MKELYLKIVYDVRKFSFFPVFTQEDIPETVTGRIIPFASAIMQNDENEMILLITDNPKLVRSTINRKEYGIRVVFVGEYDAVSTLASSLEDIWYPFDEPEFLKHRFQCAVQRMKEHFYFAYFQKHTGMTIE